MEIIVMINGQYKILNMKLHEYIDLKYKDDNKFMIYPVDEKEYEIMKEKIKYGYLNEKSTENFMGHDELRYLIEYNSENNNIIVDNYNIEVDDVDDYLIGSYVLDADGFHHFERENEQLKKFEGIKIFTTARYEDVIVSYFHEFVNTKAKIIEYKIFNTKEELTQEEKNFYIKCITNSNLNKADKDKVKSKIISK